MGSLAVVPAVGGVVTGPDGRLLVVQRAHAPSAGLWSVPGGKVEPGEADEEAVAREVAEETGLTVRVGRLLGEVDVPGAGVLFRVRDFACTPVGGSLLAGGDAREARYVDGASLRALPLVPGLLAALGSWGVLPA
ncbi:NUDIX domain-containing protein [Motilibacter aurantiacus]|uniref:NUDIX domain-containing protein n=1 Tax=Motilibacter aurantiacus TaxID=2714955 RepID=UPI00140B13B3|nr:NUDIX domain-containing protein [Motilibacter aurantiacus]NHC45684.1 NUDIX domain-containing protein [Motilibacter aurantiacus]